jgi:hypothetical protein
MMERSSAKTGRDGRTKGLGKVKKMRNRMRFGRATREKRIGKSQGKTQRRVDRLCQKMHGACSLGQARRGLGE